MSRQETVRSLIEATPAATAIVVSNSDLDWWLKAAGIAFLVLQALYLLWRWRRDVRRDAQGKPPVETL